MSDTQPRKVNPMVKCGHCNVGHHECCPSAVRNGDGSVVLCGCERQDCRERPPRCTDCNNREPGTVGEDWRCTNKADCEAEQERRAQANPVVQRVRAIREAHGRGPVTSHESQGVGGPEKRTSSPRAPRSTGRPCLCGCTETTGGGKFRPGHDSKYLTKLVEAGDEQSRTLAYDVSEAFGAKYEKRVASK